MLAPSNQLKMVMSSTFTKKNCILFSILHVTGFEPVMFTKKTDYEPAAIDHSAIHALTLLKNDIIKILN